MNVELLAGECIEWIRAWFERNAPNSCAIVGMSGGKDSTVVAALCAKALGPDRVTGVAMPSAQQSLNEADEICKALGINYLEYNIGDVESAFRSLDADFSTQSILNIPPRIRMTLLYAVSQTYNGMVANTCNLSEDYVGYATLYGDASGSFSPISRLCVREVVAIGKYLGVPEKWADKVPDDGLPGSCPDEVKFGFTYAVLDRYIREGLIDDEKIKARIDSMHERNRFKTEILHIPAYEPRKELL